jgi:hypothetical protein
MRPVISYYELFFDLRRTKDEVTVIHSNKTTKPKKIKENGMLYMEGTGQ